MIRACEARGCTPFCRPNGINRASILKLLDVGAKGLIVPHIKTVDEAKELVSYSKYFPLGDRGFSPTRKDGWGCALGMGIPETMEYFNNEVMLFPQCETVEALECIEDIVAVDGVDGIFIGPNDLSIAMGIPGQFTNPVFLAALDRILKACKEAGKPYICFTMNTDGIREGFEKGYDSMTFNIDTGPFIHAGRDKLAQFKDE